MINDMTKLRIMFPDWLLPMLMTGQVQVNSSDAGDVDGGLGMVAESGEEYKKK